MVLQTIWFLLWGLLWAIYFVTDGFDLGIGALLPFLGKTDEDRRIMYNAMGPLWDGNEVWLITAGGVTFAAFPKLYAVMFSSLYSALMLILFCLIVRGVSFEFRNKVESTAWKKVWDTCMFLGSALPAILLGVAFANIFRGLPIDQNGILHGNLFSLLNPYGWLGGALFLALFLVHGATWLAMRTEGDLHERASAAANKLWYYMVAAVLVFLIVSAFATHLYDNYLRHFVLFIVLIIAVITIIATKVSLVAGNFGRAWIWSGITIISATFFGVIGLFPNMFPSTINPAYSLTAFNASSSTLTLKIMLIVALIFVPIVLAYQAWAYLMFRGKISEEELGYDEGY